MYNHNTGVTESPSYKKLNFCFFKIFIVAIGSYWPPLTAVGGKHEDKAAIATNMIIFDHFPH